MTAWPRLRREVREHWWRYAALAVQVVLLAAVASRHEPFMDEAQAWLLARDAPLPQLFTRFIRYEGSPGLWHLLLAVPARAGLPYASITVVAVVLAAASAFLVVRVSPLPAPLALLLSWSYYLAYQYAVVARSYVLLTLLTLGAAAAWRSRYRRPWPLVVCVALMANTSVHGLLMACALSAHLVLGAAVQPDRAAVIGRHRAALAVLAAGIAAAVAQLVPPGDLQFAPGLTTEPRAVLAGARTRLLDAFATHWQVALALLSGSTVWFAHRRVLGLWFGLTLPVLALMAVRYANAWHEGLLVLAWVFAVWVSFDEPRRGRAQVGGRQAFAVLAGVVLLGQVWWTAQTYWREWGETYSGAGQVASYIRSERLEHARIFATGWHSVAIQPYFDRNIFANYDPGGPFSFHRWTTAPHLDEDLGRVAAEHPELVIWGRKVPGQQVLPTLPEEYEIVADFTGHVLWKGDRLEEDSYTVFRRSAAAPDAHLSDAPRVGGA